MLVYSQITKGNGPVFRLKVAQIVLFIIIKLCILVIHIPLDTSKIYINLDLRLFIFYISYYLKLSFY